MTERDDSYWERMSRAVERGEYPPVGPVELGPAAAIQRGGLEEEVERTNEEKR